MADVFDLYVKDNRTIQFKFTEPIMLEDNHVTDWVFHIPRILNNLDVSGWAWWLVHINARGQKYSELLTLSEDPESPLDKCVATYTVDYSMSIRAGVVRFSLEAINADTSGTILNEWHTQTYQAKVQDTLQGNQVEFAETESDIISALLIEVQNKVRQLTGGATPEPVSLIADMTDTSKVYLYVGEETGESTNYWYYYNGSAWVAGGLYASGITVDAVPTQGSNNAVRSGGVYDALQSAGLQEDAKQALLACFEHVAWTDEHGQDYYDALESALYGSESHEWDDGYVWLYQPTDGLMSKQSYATSQLLGPDGGAENVIGGVLRLTSPFNEGNTSNQIRYLLTPETVTAGRLAIKAKIIDTFVSSDASGVPGGLYLRLSNGTNGGHYFIGKKGDKIALKIYNGSTVSDNVVVETQIPINEPHIFELELNNSGFKVKIDHADIYTSNTFAGWYVTSNVIGCMGGPNTPNGATADIEWCAYYEG